METLAKSAMDPIPENNLLGLEPSVIEYFVNKIDRSGGPHSCWKWMGHVNKNGYGHFRYGEQGSVPRRVHRLCYELSVGPIPDGMHIHHICGHRACVNPRHLDLVSPEEHTVNLTPGCIAYENSRKTECSNGHEYTPENTLYTKTGHRHCRECNRQACESRYRKFREANPVPEQTHCLRGHPLSGDNIRLRQLPSGGVARRCLACAREQYSKKKPK